ncbi:MAG: amidohydrolase [Chloroflexi bacterium]|nr:amidohydrolase [Chloroflexota bacterium]
MRVDLVLHNANVITSDAAQPRAQAIAIMGDRFLAVGSDDAIKPLASAGTRLVDIGGHTIVPGLIDAHAHPGAAGRRHLREIDADLRSIEEIMDAVRERAAQTPPGEWVLGFKYDDTKTAEGRPLTREDLDLAAPNHPVMITHRGGHTSYVNSLAYQTAGVTEDTPDPFGGHMYRDHAGRLNGKLAELARDTFRAKIPDTLTRADYRAGAKKISEMLARAGITSIGDAGGTPDDLRGYWDAHEAGELLTRINCFIRFPFLDAMIAAGLRTGYGNEWVRVGPMKTFCDGSLSERTAAISRSYVGRPDDFGILVITEDELYAQARKAHENDWQVAVHVNGDVAIDMTVRVYERLQREMPRRDPRYRLEHCTIVNPDLIRRIKALGALPNPFSTYVYYHGDKMHEYGAERLEQMFAVKSFLDAGVMVTQTSDYPPGPFEPMMAFQSQVTRTDFRGTLWGPSQRITVEEAIRVATLHGAYASYEEHLKGSIEAGKLADLVVLGQDPTVIDPFQLINVPIERTMVGGRWVYEA